MLDYYRLLGIFKDADLAYITLAAEIILRISYIDESQNFLLHPKNIIAHSLRALVVKEGNEEIKDALYSLQNDN